jgi:Ethanolamine utilisation - propanediol utilisation
MTRVMVIGNAGGGKSTMSKALSAAHALPYYAIDKIQWKPNWVLTPEPEFTRAHEALLSQARWLIDGYGSWQSVKRRISAADTIIFVDHPISVHYWWATKRQIKSLISGRPDGPERMPDVPDDDTPLQDDVAAAPGMAAETDRGDRSQARKRAHHPYPLAERTSGVRGRSSLTGKSARQAR